MLRVYQSKNAAQAKSYFSSELTQADYYSEEQEIAGNWGGKSAAMLGLSGAVNKEAFNQLVDNINPLTGERLTSHNKQNRTPGYDLTFNAPKSLSLLYERSKDERLLNVFRDAVNSTMESIEEHMHARVRKGGKSEDRKTGNLAYAEFVHFTARPVKTKAPDPHLHAHCYTMNVTHDDQENQWKAGQFRPIKTDAPYYEAMFHSHLSKSLTDMGLNIERDGKFWTIEEIDKSTLDKFSNRTEQIEEAANKKNISNPDIKAELGAKLRISKEKGMTRDELRENWWERLDDQEKNILDNLLTNDGNDGGDGNNITAHECADYAINHQLERQSVIPLTRLKETALRYGVGQVNPEQIEQAFNARDDLMVTSKHGREIATTKQIWQEEQDIIGFTLKGYARHAKLNHDYEIGMVTDHSTNTQFELGDEQKNVVENLLQSRDRIMAVQGKAGTGKTTTLATLIDGIEKNGSSTVVLAPTADAAYDTLRTDGEKYKSETMQEASTLARFAVDDRLWKKDAVLIVDEAGLMSVRDMHILFAIAIENNNRVILTGDTAQHNSVNRGDAFRLLQEKASLAPLELEDIRRQKGEYKKAVKKIAKGDVIKGFDKLDDMGNINEEDDDETRYRSLVTNAIRKKLKDNKHIGTKETSVSKATNLHLTDAEKSDYHSYEKGQMIRFQQNAKGIKRGEQFTVSEVNKDNVLITNEAGQEQNLNLDEVGNPIIGRFNIYKREDISLSSGDRIRITEGGKSKDNRRINNGAIYQVKNINKEGDIVLDNGRILDHKKGNYDYGYVTTSYASQGKTVDHVFIAQSSENGGANSAEQFYVSVSRGKQAISLYTDDKAELRQQIERSHQRLSASELFEKPKEPKDYFNGVSAAVRYMAEKYRVQKNRQLEKANNSPSWQEKIRLEKQQEPDLSI